MSTASLIIGVAAAGGQPPGVLVAGCAGLVAGAMSMAAGEYVSVSAQADTETAELALESRELREDPDRERSELAAIYVRRGVDRQTAQAVASQLMAKDALGAHARDELGILTRSRARPVQAALASAGSFTVGAAIPLLAASSFPPRVLVVAVAIASLALLAALGAIGARTGGAPVWPATVRVTAWGAIAIIVTAAIGRLVGANL